jgi:hypothetical protein
MKGQFLKKNWYNFTKRIHCVKKYFQMVQGLLRRRRRRRRRLAL